MDTENLRKLYEELGRIVYQEYWLAVDRANVSGLDAIQCDHLLHNHAKQREYLIGSIAVELFSIAHRQELLKSPKGE